MSPCRFRYFSIALAFPLQASVFFLVDLHYSVSAHLFACTCSEGGMIRLERLIELKCINSRFLSSNCSIRAFRTYPLVEIRQTFLGRTIRGKSSDSRQQHLRQQYPPPLPKVHFGPEPMTALPFKCRTIAAGSYVNNMCKRM